MSLLIKPEKPMPVADRALVAGILALPVIGAVIGAISGFSSARQGKDQFDQAKQEAQKAAIENTLLRAENETLRKWTGTSAPRSHTERADMAKDTPAEPTR